jgi:hypothetical protein
MPPAPGGAFIANKAMTASFFFDDYFQLRTHIILTTEELLVSPVNGIKYKSTFNIHQF